MVVTVVVTVVVVTVVVVTVVVVTVVVVTKCRALVNDRKLHDRDPALSSR